MKPKFLLGLIVLAAAIGGGFAYLWNRSLALPPWYRTAAATLPDASVPLADLVASKLAEDNDGDGQTEVSFSETDLNQVVTAAIAQEPRTAPLIAVAKGINTTIEDNRIESGVVMNLSDVPLNSLPPRGQQALTQLTQSLPILADRDIYIGIEGTPQLDAGRLSLGPDSVIKIGQFTLPLTEVASRLGLSQAELEQQLANVLTQQGITLEDLQIVDGQVVIRGTR
jgi:hypothetical protein